MMEGSIPPSSFSTPTPASSSEPATPKNSKIFKPRRSNDWDRFRGSIEQLYRNDQLKLKDVKRIMEQDHGFVASEKQYKDRLAGWGVRKNIKAKEINIMIRKQEKRAARGKQTIFRVAGQQVDRKRITRFERRNGRKVDSNDSRAVKPPQESPEPSTPSDMSYYTPPPDERLATLSPHPENHHPLSFDPPDAIPGSELDTRTRPITHSPVSLTNHTPKNSIDEIYSIDEPGALEKFNRKMMEVNANYEETTRSYYSVEDPNTQPQYC
ncbi:Clr5 domain-containing protein [Aspergillus filifer]